MLDLSLCRRPPFEHQREANRRAEGREAFAYLMEMGTGKSYTAIMEMADLYYSAAGVTGVLILAPKGVYTNWLSTDGKRGELLEYMPEVVLRDTKFNLWKSSGTAGERNSLMARALLDTPGLQVLVMNIEAISSVEAAQKLCEKFLKKRKCLMIVDESTTIKNRTAIRTKKIVALGKLAAFRRILTGSPITRSPEDLYSQFDFLKKGILGHWSHQSFRGEYCVTKKIPAGPGGRLIEVVVGHRNLEQLAEAVEEHSYRVRKEDCLDLPAKIFTQRAVELTPEQKRAYASMRLDALAELSSPDQIVSTTHVITQILRLHQIVCGHTRLDTGEVVRIPSRRIDAFLDVVEEAGGDQMVVWANYRVDIDDIAQRLRALSGATVAEYHGGVLQTDRDRAVSGFQDGSIRFFVGNQQTAGRGITLTAARSVVYFSNNWDLEMRLQSEDRAHRIGQRSAVTYVDLVAEGTVDERILSALRGKMDIVQQVLQDGPGKWM